MRTIILSCVLLSVLSGCTKNTDISNSSPKSPQTVTATVIDAPTSVPQSSDSGTVIAPSVQ